MLGFNAILKSVFGTKNDRVIRAIQPLVDKINEFEDQYQSLSDESLRAKTNEFRDRLKKGETLEDLLPEAFATVKNACRRLMGQSWEVSGHPITNTFKVGPGVDVNYMVHTAAKVD